MNFPKIETINSRETYLAYRAEWKATYKTLSQEIRALKPEIKNIMRSGGYAGNEQGKLSYLSNSATNMLAELEEAKALARAHRDQTKAAA